MGMINEWKQTYGTELREGVRMVEDAAGGMREERFTEQVLVPKLELVQQWVADIFDGLTSAAEGTIQPNTAALAFDVDARPAPTDVEAAQAIDSKIDPSSGNMNRELAGLLYRMYSTPTYRGAVPEGSPHGPVWFRNFYLDENRAPNEPPDAQVYTYNRNGELATFEVVGAFARAYDGIDPGRAGSNSRLGLPTSGRELVTPDHPLYANIARYAARGVPIYFQNFENGVLVQTDPGGPGKKAKFLWLDNDGRVVAANRVFDYVDLDAARGINGGVVRPLGAPITNVSEFLIRDPEGAPSDDGYSYHAAKDWFAPAGTTVRSPVDGEIVEVRASTTDTGQVFGGTVTVRDDEGRLWVFRHVDPASVTVGQQVVAGEKIATVTDWQSGPDHTHVEVWKTASGGYDVENMIDPMEFFRRYVGT